MILAAGLLGLAGTAQAVFGDRAWILVDTERQSLAVMKDDRMVERFEDISIGRGGAALERRRGDDRTPLGVFRVVRINPRSNYYRFYGLDYPTEVHASRALEQGLIDESTYRSIVEAEAAGETPPQDTALGGQLGIHGLGSGDRKTHGRFNWTKGCVALTNEQIDRLDRWVRLGTVVVVK